MLYFKVVYEGALCNQRLDESVAGGQILNVNVVCLYQFGQNEIRYYRLQVIQLGPVGSICQWNVC